MNRRLGHRQLQVLEVLAEAADWLTTTEVAGTARLRHNRTYDSLACLSHGPGEVLVTTDPPWTKAWSADVPSERRWKLAPGWAFVRRGDVIIPDVGAWRCVPDARP